jgi:hypothetical protein
MFCHAARARRIVATASNGTTSTTTTAVASARDWPPPLAAVVLGAFALIGAFRIGLFYVPAGLPAGAGNGLYRKKNKPARICLHRVE